MAIKIARRRDSFHPSLHRASTRHLIPLHARTTHATRIYVQYNAFHIAISLDFVARVDNSNNNLSFSTYSCLVKTQIALGLYIVYYRIASPVPFVNWKNTSCCVNWNSDRFNQKGANQTLKSVKHSNRDMKKFNYDKQRN